MPIQYKIILEKKGSFLSCIALLCLIVIFTGCTSSGALGDAAKSLFTFSDAKIWVEKVRFSATPDINNNAPVAVNIVVVYDPILLERLSLMSADKYFEQLEQFRRDIKSGTADIFSWEIVPGQNLEDQPIVPTKVSGLAALVFARYSSPGEHRVLLGEEKMIQITLQKLDFFVQPVNP